MQVLEEQVDSAQVNFDNEEPLGVIFQDPLNAQHVLCIKSMSIGPITRPCIDTVLCNPGTTSDHFVTCGKGECTSRLQANDEDDTQELEQEA